MKKVIFITFSIYLAVLFFALLIFQAWKYNYNNDILVQNVFDHMYYAKAYSNIISEEEQTELDYSRRVYSYGFTTRKSFCDSASYYEKYLNSPFDLPNLKILISIDSPLLPILELDDYDVSEYGGMYIIFTTQFEPTNIVPYDDKITMRYFVYNNNFKTSLNYKL